MEEIKEKLKNLKMQDWGNRLVMEFNTNRKKYYRGRKNQLEAELFLNTKSSNIFDLSDLGMKFYIETNEAENFNVFVTSIVFNNKDEEILEISDWRDEVSRFEKRIMEIPFNKKYSLFESIIFNSDYEENERIKNLLVTEYAEEIGNSFLIALYEKIVIEEQELEYSYENKKLIEKNLKEYKNIFNKKETTSLPTKTKKQCNKKEELSLLLEENDFFDTTNNDNI